jgi:hypothetical protein
MNQARKNVRSTKVKQAPLELAEYPEMRGKKVQDIYISTYEVCRTLLQSNRTIPHMLQEW